MPELLRSHTAFQDKYVLGHSCQPRREVLEVLCAASQKKWAPPRFDGPRDIVGDRLITGRIVHQCRIDVLDCGPGDIGWDPELRMAGDHLVFEGHRFGHRAHQL